MLITLAQFRAFLPAFGSVPDEAVEMQIDLADPMFCARSWGKSLVAGVSYYVAHNLVVNGYTASPDGATPSVIQGGFGSGALTASRTGELSKQFSDAVVQKQVDNPFYRTFYGQQFLYLRKQLFGGAGFVACPRL